MYYKEINYKTEIEIYKKKLPNISQKFRDNKFYKVYSRV